MITGVDVSSFQGQPGQWRAAAGDIAWAAVKLTELSAGGRYVNPDAAADWAFLKAQGLGRVAYMFGHPSQAPAASVGLFSSELEALGLADADAIALDLEVTDGLGPGGVASWARSVMGVLRGAYRRPPLLYTFRSFPASGNCDGLGAYPLWISDPDHPAGQPMVPGPWHRWAIHQYGITGAIDRDVAAYPDLAAMAAALGKPPAPPPAAPRKAPDMILVQPDKAGVPAGTPWPGVFLLSSDGTLHHVTGPEGGTDNVAAYQKAGIPGPVTITWAEYQARLA
jgi:hypothetical protein